MEYEISPDYMPISPSALRTDTTVGCDIYLLAKTTIEVRFVLYCTADAVFDEAKKNMLVAQKIKSLFIKKEEQQIFFDYLENNFQHIISDTSIPADERTKIVHGAATNLVKDLFQDPRSGSVERTKAFAHNMVDYVIKDTNAAQSLMKIAVHEYYTYTHSVNVAAVGTLFGQNLGLGVTDLKGLCAGILLHDVGKTKISTEILNKKGKLTKEEFEIIKKHPEYGAEVLNETGSQFKEERIVTLQHHENDDGTGYPLKLKGGNISYLAKCAKIIDEYDTLMSNNTNHDFVDRHFETLTMMISQLKTRFDKQLLAQFVKFLATKHGDANILNEFHKEKTYKLAV